MAAQTAKERVFAHFAVQHNRTLPDYITTIEAWLAGHIRHARVHLRMRVRDFEMFLRDDRYRTQFEGMRSGGAQHVSARILVEETVLGVPASSRPLDRPIYGYMSCSDEAGVIQQYGEVVLVLKQRVRNRATFVVGDTLDNALRAGGHGPWFAPRPISAPNTLALSLEDPLTASTPADIAPAHRYWEAQIYGGLRTADVSEVAFTLGVQPSPRTVQQLASRGLQWYVTHTASP
jgi:hypothetical protein